MTDTKNTVSDEPSEGVDAEGNWFFTVIVDDDTSPETDYEREEVVTIPARLVDRIKANCASIPGCVGVKGLEWHLQAGSKAAPHWTASTPFGVFEVYKQPNFGRAFKGTSSVSGIGGSSGDDPEALKSIYEREFSRRILSSLDLSPAEGEASDGSEQAAVEIADAVIAWMVRYDLLDADQEYRDDDIIAVLDELSPGLETTNDEAFASPLAAPSNPVISDEMAKISDEELSRLVDHVGHGDGVDGPEVYSALRELQQRRATRVTDEMVGRLIKALRPLVFLSYAEAAPALTAALSVKPQSGENL